MRQTIIENTRSIEELRGRRGDLEQQNARLQKELSGRAQLFDLIPFIQVIFCSFYII